MELSTFGKTCDIWDRGLILDPIKTSVARVNQIYLMYQDVARYENAHSAEVEEMEKVCGRKEYTSANCDIFLNNIIIESMLHNNLEIKLGTESL